MSATTSLTHSPLLVQEELPHILNIARHGRRWFVELATESRVEYARRSGGRQSVTPEVGKAVLDSAQRQGLVERTSRWGGITTWHLVEPVTSPITQEEEACPVCGEPLGPAGHYGCKWAPDMAEDWDMAPAEGC